MKTELLQFQEVLQDVSLKPYNTLHIGGVCKYMVFPHTCEELQQLLLTIQENHLKYFILGNGSNVILSDEYYDGVVILLSHFDQIVYEGNQVHVGAGVLMPKFSMDVVSKGYSGFEWAVGIPGTIGGCIVGNAEAYKESTFDYLVDVTVLYQGTIQVMKKEELSYAYRTSFFKEHPGYVILEATFQLSKGNYEESMEIIKKRKEKRMNTQPLEFPSAGSVFRNPLNADPSGKLIEDIGLKGTSIGGAQVSQKHANFIINTGNATSNDVRNLIELVHDEVKKHYGIDLEMEQEYVGWD